MPSDPGLSNRQTTARLQHSTVVPHQAGFQAESLACALPVRPTHGGLYEVYALPLLSHARRPFATCLEGRTAPVLLSASIDPEEVDCKCKQNGRCENPCARRRGQDSRTTSPPPDCSG